MATAAQLLGRKPRAIYSVGPDAPVLEAVRLMAEYSVGALLVMTGEKLVGVISERDYARKVILRDRSSKQTQVRDIMTSPVLTVTSQHTVEECMCLMTENRIRHLPVVDGGRVSGMISIGDLVNWIITAHEETIGQLRSYIAGSYPG